MNNVQFAELWDKEVEYRYKWVEQQEEKIILRILSTHLDRPAVKEDARLITAVFLAGNDDVYDIFIDSHNMGRMERYGILTPSYGIKFTPTAAYEALLPFRSTPRGNYSSNI